MSSAGPQAAAPRPSVFLSYASDDRAAARLLRDALATAGIDVWYDESELGGGDAWDQKIRRQIRDCDYFMPVISANTERRKEGYFRREWRLAVERTLDMADDVLFLLPVVIDDTNEARARVPEKFLTVQWLRAPAGHAGAALDALGQRLLAGDHTPLTPPIEPPNASSRTGHRAAPLPMPPFPAHPHRGAEWPKFIAEIVWWMLNAAWFLWKRLPRIVRVGALAWLVVTLIGKCNQFHRPDPDNGPAAGSQPDIAAAIRSATNAALQPGAGTGPGFKVDVETTRQFVATLLDENIAGKPLVLLRFSGAPETSESGAFAARVFTLALEKLQAARPADVALARFASDAAGTETLRLAGATLSASHVLGGVLSSTSPDASLIVSLIRGSNGGVAWSETYPVSGTDPQVAADQIATAALAALPPLTPATATPPPK